MLTYNTRLKKLILPEYGRNIQKMVDHCLGLPDKDERTRCATAIVNAMETLFQPQGDVDEYRRKLWDHLAIMSDFSLDIDWPYEVVRPDELDSRPDPIPLYKDPVDYRHYGRSLVNMIRVAADMEPGEERDALALLLANQMKKTLLLANPEVVEDERVFKDLRKISHGVIDLDAAKVKLYDYKALPVPKKKKKK